MSDNKFDKKIGEILNNAEAPYEPGSWDAMSKKLDQMAAPAPDPAGEAPRFDNMMRTALSGIEPAYQPSHWNMLSQRLDNQVAVRRVRLHKVAEAAIILIVVANFQAFLDGGMRLFHMPIKEKAPAQEVPMANKSHKRSNSKGAAPTIGTAVSMDVTTATGNNGSETLMAANNGQFSADNSIGSTVIAAAVPPTVGSAILDPNGRPVPAGLRPLTLLAALGLDLIDYQQNVEMAGVHTTPVTKPGKHRSNGVYLMASVNAYRHRLKDANDYVTQFNTVGAGLSAGIRKGKWSAEAGLAYSPQAFSTDTHVFEFFKKNNTTYGVSYDQIQADVVDVPVKVLREVARFGRTRLHVTAGATAHLAVQKNATYKNIQYASAPPSPKPLTDEPVLPSNKGVLEGGNVGGNSYVSVDAGVRIEHKISARASAFVEPQYRRFASGKGYSNEKSKTQSIGFQAGVIAAL